MPDLAQLNLVVDSSQVTVANNQMNIMVGVSGKAEVAIRGLGDQTQKTGEAHRLATGSMGELLKMVVALTGAYGALQSIRVGLETAATEDRLLKGFTNITQSAKQAQDILNQLENFSKSSQFEFAGLADAAREFMALGQTGEQSIKIVEAIGKELETIGSGSTNIDAVSNSFKRMLETGQANLFLFRSLAGQGIPAVQMLAKALGVDVNEAMNLLRKNAISGADAVKVLTEGMLANANQAKNNEATYTQLWQMLKNNLILAIGDTVKALGDNVGFKGTLKSLITDIQLFGMVLGDAIRILEGLPTKYKSTTSAATELAAIIRTVIVLFELWLALKMIQWVTDFALSIPKLVASLFDMGAGAKVAVSMLALLTAVEVGRWAEENYKPVAKLFANVKAFLGLLGASTDFVGSKIGDAFSPNQNDMAKMGGQGKVDLLGSGVGGTDDAAAHAKIAFDQVMKQYDKDITDINNRPAQTDPNKTNFFRFMQGDFTSMQSQMNTIMKGGGLELKLPNGAAMAKEFADFQKQFTGATGSSDTHIQPQITEQLQQQLDKEISKLKDEASVVGMISDQRDKQLKILQMMDVLKEHGIDPNRSDSQQFLNELDQAISRLQRLKEIQEIGKGIGDAFAKSFGEFITGAKNAQQAAKDFGNALEQVLLKKLVLDKIANFIEAGIGGIGKAFNPAGAPSNTIDVFGSNSSMPIQSSVLDVSPNAMGGAYWKGVRQFGSGDVFNRPTMFNIGMMGEAGPEAIMPLTRRSDGKLGIAGGGGSTVHQYNFNISTPDSDSFRRSTRQIAATAKRAFS